MSLADSDVQTFLEGEENQYMERKTESYVFINDISRGWERKSTIDRFWPCTWMISSVGKEQTKTGEFCTLKITRAFQL